MKFRTLHYLVCVDLFSSHVTRSLEAKVVVLPFHFFPATLLCCLGRSLKQLNFLKSCYLLEMDEQCNPSNGWWEDVFFFFGSFNL
ncbi:hypothetical protein VNO77_20147 [Canavalia gladiata]|uniref:Uncharacterized protein n=1 Tax=Canavalia gladiata TaxID=3824 RepID=A0AAN9LPM2_CANGL